MGCKDEMSAIWRGDIVEVGQLGSVSRVRIRLSLASSDDPLSKILPSIGSGSWLVTPADMEVRCLMEASALDVEAYREFDNAELVGFWREQDSSVGDLALHISGMTEGIRRLAALVWDTEGSFCYLFLSRPLAVELGVTGTRAAKHWPQIDDLLVAARVYKVQDAPR